MARFPVETRYIGASALRCKPAVCLVLLLSSAAVLLAGEDQRQRGPQRDLSAKACKVLADKRLREPLQAIAKEYSFRTGFQITLNLCRQPR